MSLPEAFLLLSGLAYFAFAAAPDPCTYNIDKGVERIAFFLTGSVILLSLQIAVPILYRFLGVLYVAALSASYLGYVTWRVRWSDKPENVVQVAMWLWDLAIALCFFILSEIKF